MFPNRFTGLTDALKAEVTRRVGAIFADIDADKSPLAHGIQTRGNTIVDLLDGVIHAVAELEKRLPPPTEQAA